MRSPDDERLLTLCEQATSQFISERDPAKAVSLLRGMNLLLRQKRETSNPSIVPKAS